jgi:hypothetical protein
MLVKIEGKDIQRIEYKGQPVIALSQIDKLHKRPDTTARQSFQRHRKWFVENEDFFTLPYVEWSRIFGSMPDIPPKVGRGGHRGPMHIFTESGYLLLVKVFDDELSWKIQRQLIKCYFRVKAEAIPPPPPAIQPPPTVPAVRKEPWAWYVEEKQVVKFSEIGKDAWLKLIPIEMIASMMGASFHELIELLSPEALHYIINDTGVPIPHDYFPCPHHDGDMWCSGECSRSVRRSTLQTEA